VGVVGVLPWLLGFLTLLYGVDRRLGPMAAMGAVRRAFAGGRALGVALLVLCHAVILFAGLWLVKHMEGLERLAGVALLIYDYIALHFGLARLYGAASEADARAAVQGGAVTTLAPARPETGKSAAARLLLTAMIFMIIGQEQVETWVPAAELAPWLGAWAGPIVRLTMRLVPVAIAVVLLAHDELSLRRVQADEAGLLLDGGPRWPGTRAPWDDLGGYRRQEDGIKLVVRPAPAEFGPLLPGDDATVAWLERRGVRADA
jgi:hypothetical protein